VSSGSPEVTRAAIEVGAPIIALAYNLYHQMELDQFAKDLAERKIGVLAHSVLAHGLLTGSWPGNKEFPPGDHRAERWTRDGLKRRLRQLSAIRPSLQEGTVSMRSVALRFALANPAVSSVILGARTALQLDQLVREAGKAPPYMSQFELDELRRRLTWAGAVT
jgi:aryl-alcohol dehydrogenase-like predicted oxidoreductase